MEEGRGRERVRGREGGEGGEREKREISVVLLLTNKR